MRAVSMLVTALGLLGSVAACGSPTPAAQPTQAAPAAPAKPAAAPASPAATQAPVLLALFPAEIALGAKFNEQPDGRSALAVKMQSATASSSIVFNGTALKTEINPDNVLTAFVPADLLSKAGAFTVVVRDGAAESNPLTFTIKAP